MAMVDDHEALQNALSGMQLGVEEESLKSILPRWQHPNMTTFRKQHSSFFTVDNERQFEKLNEGVEAILAREFLRFQRAVLLHITHPWERDARFINDALARGPEAYSLIIEVACTRTSDELLGARKAYHSLFDCSIEEDVASKVTGPERKLLVALVSSYRYEGHRFDHEDVKSKALTLQETFRGESPMENDDVVWILSTKSKYYIKALTEYYKEITGQNILQEIREFPTLITAFQCLFTPDIYFCQVLEISLRFDADHFAQEALTRVFVTREGDDLKRIAVRYHDLGQDLQEIVKGRTRGNLRDYLLAFLVFEN